MAVRQETKSVKQNKSVARGGSTVRRAYFDKALAAREQRLRTLQVDDEATDEECVQEMFTIVETL
jgi:hypothetical protein